MTDSCSHGYNATRSISEMLHFLNNKVHVSNIQLHLGFCAMHCHCCMFQCCCNVMKIQYNLTYHSIKPTSNPTHVAPNHIQSCQLHNTVIISVTLSSETSCSTLYKYHCRWRFLGAFAKLRKATISFITSVRPSTLPHGLTGLKLGI
jgi:hypothetical protein